MSEGQSRETRDLVLKVAVELLWRHDETELRIIDVCHDSGLSSSVIYSYFGSRQGLVDTAYLHIYRHVTTEFITTMHEAVASHDASLINQYLEEQSADPARREYWRACRHMRLRVATAALARPGLRQEFAKLQDAYFVALTGVFEGLQQKRIVGNLFDAHQLALLFEGLLLYRSFNDIALNPDEHNHWMGMLSSLLSAVAPRASETSPV